MTSYTTLPYESVQERISRNIKRFDICALLKLLKELGYHKEDLYFESNADLSSPTSLCHAIFFSEQFPKVRIVLNLGLLSVNSPLPNFFRKKMDSGSIDPVLFSKFLGFFDHHLIKNLLSMSMPDLNDTFFTSWLATKNHYLKLLDFNSTSTLWHLFQACFPELTVRIIKAPRLFKQNSSSTMLGTTRLGKESYLGKKIIQTIPSFKFILLSDETKTDLSIPWPSEIKNRLRKIIFRFLERTDIHFRVIFILRNNKEIAHLSRHSQLGYCMIGKNTQALKLLLFSGYSKNLGRLYQT
jgi:predicted component of type VI protein secretion system